MVVPCFTNRHKDLNGFKSASLAFDSLVRIFNILLVNNFQFLFILIKISVFRHTMWRLGQSFSFHKSDFLPELDQQSNFLKQRRFILYKGTTINFINKHYFSWLSSIYLFQHSCKNNYFYLVELYYVSQPSTLGLCCNSTKRTIVPKPTREPTGKKGESFC